MSNTKFIDVVWREKGEYDDYSQELIGYVKTQKEAKEYAKKMNLKHQTARGKWNRLYQWKYSIGRIVPLEQVMEVDT